MVLEGFNQRKAVQNKPEIWNSWKGKEKKAPVLWRRIQGYNVGFKEEAAVAGPCPVPSSSLHSPS